MDSRPLKPFAWYKSLLDAKSRREENAFLIEGNRAIAQISRASPGSIRELVAEEKNVPPGDLVYPVRIATTSQFRSICLSANPSGPLAVVALPEGSFSQSLPRIKGDRLLVLEDVQDPGNVGTLIRSAAAFDFSGIILSDKCADPFGPKAIQASAGSILSQWVRKTAEYATLVAGLAAEGYDCIAADVKGKETLGPSRSSKIAVILGNEGSGLSAEALGMATHVVRIPICGSKAESLNVAVSGALFMYVLSSLRA